MTYTKIQFKSIDDLLERILSLDFHKDLVQENHVDLQKLQSKIKWHLPLEPLPVIMSNIEKYHMNFFSLFMVECLESITQDKYDSMSMPRHALPVSANIRGVFGDVTLSMDLEKSEYLAGDLVCLCIAKANSVANKRDNAIQMKSEQKIDKTTQNAGTKLLHLFDKNSMVSALGYVTSVKKNRIVVKILVYPPKFITSKIYSHKDLDRLFAVQQKFQNIVNSNFPGFAAPGSEHKLGTLEEWYIAKLSSLTTMLREFNALCMMEQMPLRNLLLKVERMDSTYIQPNICTKLSLNFRIPSALKKTLESKYNSGQLSAISNSLNQAGISLIQGPPGTGKTTTIIGIISVILYALTPTNSKRNDYKRVVHPRNTFHIKNPWYFHDEKDFAGGYFDDLNYEDDGHDYDRIYNIYDSLNSVQRTRCNNIQIDFKGKSSRRILMCAPSNAAVDEIVKRLVAADGGILDANGNRYQPTVTRVGPNFHEDLIEYSLNTKVDKWFSKNALYIKDEKTVHFKRAAIAKDILLNSEIVCSTLSGCGSKEFYGLINCFDTLIIDEATQAVELSTLIPLNLGCKRAILVGDPCQLSATVCSKAAIQLNYEQSLFKRLQLCGYPVNFLKLQYRMDPQITRFPSMYFYKNQLINADSFDSRKHLGWRKFPLLRPTVFYAIDSQESRSDTSYVNEMEVELVCQLLEIIIEILLSIPGMTPEEIKQKIAVISPYSAQVDILKSTIYERITLFHNPLTLTPEETKTTQIYISTVDGFQGMEKDIIIFSAVRTKYVGSRKAINAKIEDLTSQSILTIDQEPHDPESLRKFQCLMDEYLEKSKNNPPNLDSNVNDASFISDRRRINVAITRARNNLFIVGNPRYLLDHRHWYALYNHYAKTGALFICHTVNNQLKKDFLKDWIVEYIKRAPAEYKELLEDRQLRSFMEKLV